MRLRKLKSISLGRDRLVVVGGETILFCSCGGASSLFMEAKVFLLVGEENKTYTPLRS